MANANGTDSKFNKAVDNATSGKSTALAKHEAAPMIVTAPGQAMVREISKEEIDKITARPDLEFAPQVMKLEQGQVVEGILEGNGPDAEFERVDRATGEVTTGIVQTWILRHPHGGQRISILSSVQLDKKMPPFVGGLVTIVRGKDINIANGHRVTDYLVCGPKLASGERRSWAIQRPAIDVQEAPALPASGESSASAPSSAAS